MSKLAVGSLEGLASEGYKISVASGSKLVQAGAVLQVVSTTKTDTFSTSSTSFTDVTGLTATITPSSTSSLILVLFTMSVSVNSTAAMNLRMRRGSTSIGVGASAGSRTPVSTQFYNNGSFQMPMCFSILDNPATTSATTYGVQVAARDAAVNVYVNRQDTDTDAAGTGRGASTITVMEIAG